MKNDKIRNYLHLGVKDFFTKINLTKIIALIPFVLLTTLIIAFYDYCISQSIICTYVFVFCPVMYFWLLGAYSLRYKQDIDNLDVHEMDIEDIEQAIADGRLKSTMIYSDKKFDRKVG
jgi:hypothetical protein